jgi:hypothetical protein
MPPIVKANGLQIQHLLHKPTNYTVNSIVTMLAGILRSTEAVGKRDKCKGYIA